MHLFYTPNISPHDTLSSLNEEESRHCVKVLRLQKGDLINLVDGKGGLYSARILHANAKKVALSILNVDHEFGKRAQRLHLAVAPTKNIERFEWLLEKATEIGIEEITPIVCERSERKALKIERLEKVLVSAMKQSIKAFLPKLNPPVNFNDLLSSDECRDEAKLIAHCTPEYAKKFIPDALAGATSALILIGPEGDFSKTEIEKALNKGFKNITLGGARLRTETAALVACVEMQQINR